MSTPRPAEFGIVVSFVIDNTIVAARGEVDLLTAPTLQAAVGALLDQGQLNIVLDLAAVTFMDASGLRIIANVAEGLSRSGHVLTLRSASAMTLRILALTGLNQMLRLEGSDSRESESLDNEVRVQAWSRPTTEVTDAALRRITELVGATLGGADGVSVTLERDGRLTTVGASNDTVMRMDGHQYETGEGPCLSAAAHGVKFHSESLADESRWPAFVPLALEQGIASILSTPLTTAERSIGALNIYSNTERAFGPHQQELAEMFASHAAAILTDAGAIEQMDEALANALVARQTIARAQGVLMARERITANEAASSIHRSARASGVAVVRHAAAIVASTNDETSQET